MKLSLKFRFRFKFRDHLDWPKNEIQSKYNCFNSEHNKIDNDQSNFPNANSDKNWEVKIKAWKPCN